MLLDCESTLINSTRLYLAVVLGFLKSQGQRQRIGFRKLKIIHVRNKDKIVTPRNMSGSKQWTGQVAPHTLKKVNLMDRTEWGARDTRSSEYMATPVSMVFIHHTAMSRCQDHESCCHELRKIQNFHMDDRGWDDIAYSYVIGENGCVYEGRGWNRVGAHTAGWNNVAIGLSLLGDFTNVEPDPRALEAILNLLELGVAEGKISANYKLYGHKDARKTTDCPGQKLYDVIIKWDHYDPNPPVCPSK